MSEDNFAKLTEGQRWAMEVHKKMNPGMYVWGRMTKSGEFSVTVGNSGERIVEAINEGDAVFLA